MCSHKEVLGITENMAEVASQRPCFLPRCTLCPFHLTFPHSVFAPASRAEMGENHTLCSQLETLGMITECNGFDVCMGGRGMTSPRMCQLCKCSDWSSLCFHYCLIKIYRHKWWKSHLGASLGSPHDLKNRWGTREIVQIVNKAESSQCKALSLMPSIMWILSTRYCSSNCQIPLRMGMVEHWAAAGQVLPGVLPGCWALLVVTSKNLKERLYAEEFESNYTQLSYLGHRSCPPNCHDVNS